MYKLSLLLSTLLLFSCKEQEQSILVPESEFYADLEVAGEVFPDEGPSEGFVPEDHQFTHEMIVAEDPEYDKKRLVFYGQEQDGMKFSGKFYCTKCGWISLFSGFNCLECGELNCMKKELVKSKN